MEPEPTSQPQSQSQFIANVDWCDNGPARVHVWDSNSVCVHCGGKMPDTATQFAQRLERLLNAHSQENASNTPDFILARYLLDCLAAWNRGIQHREEWYGRPVPNPTPGHVGIRPGPSPSDLVKE